MLSLSQQHTAIRSRVIYVCNSISVFNIYTNIRSLLTNSWTIVSVPSEISSLHYWAHRYPHCSSPPHRRGWAARRATNFERCLWSFLLEWKAMKNLKNNTTISLFLLVWKIMCVPIVEQYIFRTCCRDFNFYRRLLLFTTHNYGCVGAREGGKT